MASWLARVCSPIRLETSGPSSQSRPRSAERNNGGVAADDTPSSVTVTAGNLHRPQHLVSNINNPGDDVAATCPPTPAGIVDTVCDRSISASDGEKRVRISTLAVSGRTEEAVEVGDRPRDSKGVVPLAEGGSARSESGSVLISISTSIFNADAGPAGAPVPADIAVMGGVRPFTRERRPSTSPTSGTATLKTPSNPVPRTVAKEATTPRVAGDSLLKQPVSSTTPSSEGEAVATVAADETCRPDSQQEGRGTTPWLEVLVSKAKRQHQQYQQNRKKQQQEQQLQLSRNKKDIEGTYKPNELKARPPTPTLAPAPALADVESPAVGILFARIERESSRAASGRENSETLQRQALTTTTADAAATTTGKVEHVLDGRAQSQQTSVVPTPPAPPLSPCLQALLSPATQTAPSAIPAPASPPPPRSPPKIERPSGRSKPSSKKTAAAASAAAEKSHGGGKRSNGGKRPAVAREGDKRVCAAVGAATAVKSVSPRPTSTKPRKGRARAQSLGSRETTEGSGGVGGGGQGRKSRNRRGGGNAGGSRGGGERRVLREEEDENGEDVSEGASAGADAFASPGRKGRRVYKGSEHGKVKFLFPNMSPWRRNRLRFDEESLWSVTDQNTADEISNFALLLPGVNAETVVIDGTACVGGNVISFSTTFDEVWAVEIDRDRFEMLKGNVKRSAGASPTSGRVLFFNDDFLNVLDAERQRIGEERPVVFLDPPWGGVAYKKQEEVSLFMSDTPLAEACGRAAKAGARHVLVKVPTNFNLRAFRDAVGVAGRVSVHERNMRKMLLVAVDYDRRPLPPASTPSAPSSPTSAPDSSPSMKDGGCYTVVADEVRSEGQGAVGSGKVSCNHGSSASSEAVRALPSTPGQFSQPLPLQAAAVAPNVASSEGDHVANGKADTGPMTRDGTTIFGAAGNYSGDSLTRAVRKPSAGNSSDVFITDGVAAPRDLREVAGTVQSDSEVRRARGDKDEERTSGTVASAAAGARRILKEMLGLDTSGDGKGGGEGTLAGVSRGGLHSSADVQAVHELRVEPRNTSTAMPRHVETDDGEGRGRDEVERSGAAEVNAVREQEDEDSERPMEGPRRILKGLLGLHL